MKYRHFQVLLLLYEEVLKHSDNDRSEERHKIALDSEDCEVHRVLEHLEYREIKRDQHEVNVVPHEEVYQCEAEAHEEHNAHSEACGVVEVKEYDVVNDEERNENFVLFCLATLHDL